MTDETDTDETAAARAGKAPDAPRKPARTGRGRPNMLPPERYRDDYLQSLDGRSAAARILRPRLAELYNDLGGLDALSYQERSLCRRAIFVEWRLELNERALANGEADTLSDAAHVQLTNSLIGLLRQLGLERRAKKVPDLKAYLETEYGDADVQ